MRKFFIAAITTAMLTATAAIAQIPQNYYSSLKGKKGAELKTAVHNIIKNATVLKYGSGSGRTWEGFYTTDRLDDGQVVDRYSNDKRYFGNKGQAVSGMNIEHSFPKSWWGGSENQAYKDLYNLMPSEQKINSAKSNYPMGKVTSASTDNGCTKVGTGTNGYKLWEPADKWKGDFARGYMYMATAYQDFTWSGEQALKILQQGDYPTLREWAYTLYIEWAKEDAVDQTEVKRNNAVYKIQGNRNPFVDFPNLMEYIWGDSINYAFDPENTVTTSEYSDDPVQPTAETIYKATFTSETGKFTTTNITVPNNDFEVWTQDSKYGWKGTGYANNRAYATEALLTSPEIDLTGFSEATLTFNHAVNFCKSPQTTLCVEVVCDGMTTTLDGITWPTGNNWTFIDSGEISLNAFAGKKINIVFHYKSNDTEAGTWEIKKMSVTGTRSTTGISSVTQSDAPDMSKPYKAYSIDGQSITSPKDYKGIIIIVKDGKTWKMMNR